MSESFADMLTVGGKKNSLGRAEEIVQIVLADQSRLEELYRCLFEDNAWVRMRAVDALEKVCRVHTEWLKPYVEKLLTDVAAIDQPSIQWHLAQMFREIDLSRDERRRAIDLMKHTISSVNVDWIVSSNTMETLAAYTTEEVLPAAEVVPLLEVQQTHHSNAVVKRATRLLEQLR